MPAPMRDTLAATLGPIEFSDLRSHLARDVVIVVSRTLDLLDVGEALAVDDKIQVAAWIEAGLLTKPSPELLERWSKITGPGWTSLVLAPFVLVREGVPS